MKNLFTICVALLLLTACADKKNKTLNDELQTTIEQDTKKQDSIAVSLEKSAKEIEKSSEKLDELLKDL